MKRVLVIGHRGMLGSDLMTLLASGKVETRGVDLPEVDIADPKSVADCLDAFGSDVVINCAAWTDVDGAESHREEAMHVNGVGAGNVAHAAAACGAKVVHVSTDFVFDGTKDAPYVENDTPCPISVYGESKLDGERRVADAADDHLIVRTSWLYGAHGRNFVATMLRLSDEKDELTVVDDQRGSPTWTRDLSRAILALVDVDARGIVHACGRGECSWYEFACEIVKRAGSSTPVRPITSAEFDRPASRPANSALDTTKLHALTGFTFPAWQDSLAAFMEERPSS